MEHFGLKLLNTVEPFRTEKGENTEISTQTGENTSNCTTADWLCTNTL